MFCSQQILFSLFITHLLPYSSASAISQEPEGDSAAGPGLRDPSTSDIPQLGRRDEDFADWLNSQAHDTSPVDSHKFRRSLAIIDLAANPAVDGPQAADGPALSSRDVEANSAPDAVPDVERSPHLTEI